MGKVSDFFMRLLLVLASFLYSPILILHYSISSDSCWLTSLTLIYFCLPVLPIPLFFLSFLPLSPPKQPHPGKAIGSACSRPCILIAFYYRIRDFIHWLQQGFLSAALVCGLNICLLSVTYFFPNKMVLSFLFLFLFFLWGNSVQDNSRLGMIKLQDFF